ncbi:MAG: hypothetical protein ACI8UX_002055, partial [Psychromonas sp.]
NMGFSIAVSPPAGPQLVPPYLLIISASMLLHLSSVITISKRCTASSLNIVLSSFVPDLL